MIISGKDTIINNNSRFRVNAPNIVHEMIDGEVVIVNLQKGHYYSLISTGAEIWSDILEGLTKDEVVQRLLNRYDVKDMSIEKAVSDFLIELQENEIIVSITPGDEGKSGLNGNSHVVNRTEKRQFEIPVLSKFTDMEELLLLDPIHDVDEMGWPNMAENPSEKGK